MQGRARRSVIAVTTTVLVAVGGGACSSTSHPAASPPAPTAAATPDDFETNVRWAARNLLGWRCSFDTVTTFVSRPTGDGIPWRTLASDRSPSVTDVARYELRLADYDLLEQVRYRCRTGSGTTSGEVTQRTPNAAPALEAVRPDGTRIALISVGGF